MSPSFLGHVRPVQCSDGFNVNSLENMTVGVQVQIAVPGGKILALFLLGHTVQWT